MVLSSATRWAAVLSAAILASCRPPAPVRPAPAPRAAYTLVCAPRVLTVRDTLVIALPAPGGKELSIEDPRGVFYQLVMEQPSREAGPQLMTSAELEAARELRLAVAALVALPYVYRAQAPERVFRTAGNYRIRLAERLNTDDGTPVADCVVRYQPSDGNDQPGASS